MFKSSMQCNQSVADMLLLTQTWKQSKHKTMILFFICNCIKKVLNAIHACKSKIKATVSHKTEKIIPRLDGCELN